MTERLETEDKDDIYAEDKAEISALETIDPVRQYLNEIGKVALLTAEEEVELSKDIEAGLYAQKLLEGRPSASGTQYEQSDLETIAATGKKSYDRMLAANLRLSVSIAKRYQNRGLDMLELFQEGNLGLVRGIEKFDYEKGYKFSTYATWWIRQNVTRALADQGRTIRLPVHMVEQVNKLRRIEREFLEINGRLPDDDEAAAALNVAASAVYDIKYYDRQMVSLDKPVGSDSASSFTLADIINVASGDDPESAAEAGHMREGVSSLLKTLLTEREQLVIDLRFGMTTGQPETLDMIGARIGVTRERIRQIEKKAMDKLRKPGAAKHLEDYI